MAPFMPHDNMLGLHSPFGSRFSSDLPFHLQNDVSKKSILRLNIGVHNSGRVVEMLSGFPHGTTLPQRGNPAIKITHPSMITLPIKESGRDTHLR